MKIIWNSMNWSLKLDSIRLGDTWLSRYGDMRRFLYTLPIYTQFAHFRYLLSERTGRDNLLLARFFYFYARSLLALACVNLYTLYLLLKASVVSPNGYCCDVVTDHIQDISPSPHRVSITYRTSNEHFSCRFLVCLLVAHWWVSSRHAKWKKNLRSKKKSKKLSKEWNHRGANKSPAAKWEKREETR